MRHAAAFFRTVRAAFSGRSPRPGVMLGALALGFCASLVILAGPSARRHIDEVMAHAAPGESGWALGVGAVGMALLGGAAVVFVLARLTREAEQRPYASLAPVLAVFSACVLIGLHAQLPLPGIASEVIAVFALLAAVCGGALVRAPTLGAQLSGLALALFPALSLVVVLWAATGEVDPARALGGLAPRALAFLGMLLVSSFGVALIATLGRATREQAADQVASLEVGAQSSDARGAPSWRAVFLGAVALVVACGGVNIVLSRPRLDSTDAQLAVAQASALVIPTASAARDPEPVIHTLPSAARPSELDEVDAPLAEPAARAAELALMRVAAQRTASTREARAPARRTHHRDALASDEPPERAAKSKIARRQVRAQRRVEGRRPASPRGTPPPWGDVLTQVAQPAKRTPKRAPIEDDTPEAAAESAAKIAARAAAQHAPARRGGSGDGNLDDLMTRALGK